MMGFYSDAVTMALQYADDKKYLELAKKYANMPENKEVKKRLWL